MATLEPKEPKKLLEARLWLPASVMETLEIMAGALKINCQELVRQMLCGEIDPEQ